MYLPEEKRAQIRDCIKKHQAGSGEDKQAVMKWLHDTEDTRKVSQLLFEARDGKEVFTPF